MIKKIISILFVVILIVVCVLGYIKIEKQSNFEPYNVFDFVGNDAAVHIRINNPMLLCTNDNENSDFLNLIYSDNKFIIPLIINLIPDAADTNFVVRRNSVYILSSAFANDDNSLDFVHFIPVKKYSDINDIAKKITDTLNSNSDILCYEIDNSKFYVHSFGNLIAVSSELNALETNLKQVKNKQTLSTDALFTEGINSAGRYVDANIFVSSAQLPKIINALLSKKISDADADFIKNIAQWFILDADITKNLCNLNGFIYLDNQNFLNLLATQQKSDLKTLKMLSPETLVAYSMQISNIDSLLNEYNNFFSRDNENNYFDNLTQMSDSLYSDVVQLIKSLYPEEITLTYNPSQGWITLIKVLNTQNAENELSKLNKISSLSDIVSAIFGKFFSINKGKEVSIVDNFIVISKNKINNLLNNGILSVNSDYIIDESLAAFYANPTGISKFFDIPKNNNKDLFKNIFIEIIPSNNKIYLNSNISLGSSSAVQKKPQKTVENTETTTASETVENTNITPQSPAVILRQTIENEVDKQRYVVLQYSNNTIELTDIKAKSLWTKNLDEKIESSIFVINPFNKGVVYLLFNTENKIHLIDFKGNSKSSFPIALPAAATNSLSVYTYDKASDYRIFIACANKKIYLYNTNGENVSGWKIPRTEGIVQRQIQFLRMDARDYLIAVDNNKIYVLNRKGSTRTNVKDKVQIPVNAEFEKLYKPARLRVKDKSGKQITINLTNGKVTGK
ncbi:MAG: hypothetical protein LBT56_06715 [Prevotellaceae bacterium]|jgi:hypothetical protein|nr:hypothetical protein [Prevotellaceae bacterium]